MDGGRLDGGILTGKTAFQRDNCFAKVVPSIQLGVFNLSTHLDSGGWPFGERAKVVPTMLI